MSTDGKPTTCARHPAVQTALKCASCGIPICPDCLVQTPVGAKCRDCGTARRTRLFTLSPANALAAAGAGVLLGAAAGFAVTFHFGLLTLLVALAYGSFAGETILRASGRKRGSLLEAITAGSLIAGAVGGRLLVGASQLAADAHVHPPNGLLDVLVSLVRESPIPLAALVIVVAAAVSRIRYL